MTDKLPELQFLSSSSPFRADPSSFSALFSVFNRAKKERARQFTAASNSVSTMVDNPPSSYLGGKLDDYFRDVILGSVPETSWYDDVFWCCFLCLAAGTDIEECYLGGPLHCLVYEVYDDFDPRDVASDD